MIQIRDISEVETLKQIPGIEQNAWGFSDPEVEPHHLMTRVIKYGGIVQGLYFQDTLIGFSYALVARMKGELFLYSHMVAVLQSYQGNGYGFLLKKAQRDKAMSLGYEVIRWNFDPLESMNVFFNLHRLGAFSNEYERNIYGEGESGLHKGLPTDRLIATWKLNSPQVAETVASKSSRIVKKPHPDRIHTFTHKEAYIEIPAGIQEIKMDNPARALEWRMNTREHFEQAFHLGYTAVGIVFSEDSEQNFILLEQ